MSTTGTRLDPILEAVRGRAEERRRLRPLEDLRRNAFPDPARRERFVGALRGEGLDFIAECKRRSPSEGDLVTETDVAERARLYAAGGASALSILTEADHFRGSPEDLEAAATAGIPRLRKDFLLDEGMVRESAEMGADGILLLAVCLPDSRLAEFAHLARELGLATLVEVHDVDELQRGIAAAPDCIGVNARDLRTFEIDLATTEALLPQVPTDFVRVAESGLHTVEDLRRVRSAGADAALVGTALMRAPDPTETLRQWKAELR